MDGRELLRAGGEAVFFSLHVVASVLALSLLCFFLLSLCTTYVAVVLRPSISIPLRAPRIVDVPAFGFVPTSPATDVAVALCSLFPVSSPTLPGHLSTEVFVVHGCSSVLDAFAVLDWSRGLS
jgi:hypothetical protein